MSETTTPYRLGQHEPGALYPAAGCVIDSPSFGLALRGLRERRRLSMPDLAARIDMDKSSVSKMESGARQPSRATVDALIVTFELDGYAAERFRNLAGYTSMVWSRVAWDVQRAVDGRDVAA